MVITCESLDYLNKICSIDCIMYEVFRRFFPMAPKQPIYRIQFEKDNLLETENNCDTEQTEFPVKSFLSDVVQYMRTFLNKVGNSESDCPNDALNCQTYSCQLKHRKDSIQNEYYQ